MTNALLSLFNQDPDDVPNIPLAAVAAWEGAQEKWRQLKTAGAQAWELEEARAMLHYFIALCKLAPTLTPVPQIRVSALSLPFATVPAHMYGRYDERFDVIPQPEIPNTIGSLMYGHGAALNRIANLLLLHGNWPPNTEMVDDLPPHAPHPTIPPERRRLLPLRIMSAKYQHDVEEKKHFKPGTVALCFMNMVLSLGTELRHLMTQAVTLIEQPTPGKPYEIYNAITPVQVFAKREAYMLEYYAWVIGAGVVMTLD